MRTLSQVSIHCGAKVDQGKLIGLSGNTGNSTGAHLHFEVRVPRWLYQSAAGAADTLR
jgi:murein DD-endopeptidase MepM/ murein hydrolase activator NlpD